MAVEVRVSGSKTDTYESGTGIKVAEGHLIVHRGGGMNPEPVAIHAPGYWQSAQVAKES